MYVGPFIRFSEERGYICFLFARHIPYIFAQRILINLNHGNHVSAVLLTYNNK